MTNERLVHAARGAFIFAALLLAPAAYASPHHHHGEPQEGRRHWVPEFDPAAGGALIALLAGGALYIASRRKSG